jgi:hypothetical protein
VSAILTAVGLPLGVAASIATVLAIIPMTRNETLRWWRELLMQIGLPYRRYAKKFVEQFGTYDNPYLRETEQLDLRFTYVPLSVQTADEQTVELASDVIAARGIRGETRGEKKKERLIIIGDPGSGKSTLLKAYGVGAANARLAGARGPWIVPYFIQVRKLAKFLATGKELADYIVDEVLVRRGVFRADPAARFFLHTLRTRRAVVMLDGLDEIPEASQPGVLAAVRTFGEDYTMDLPTAQAVILLTCRTQNFENLRGNWVPTVADKESVHSLVPLRDAEIIDYLHRFQNKFGTADGPARFMASVRAARTLDLLRAPLILAMAVGLYAGQPERMPHTVTELYRQMIKEMLERNSFLSEDRENSLNAYQRRDKYRFLRRFSLIAVLNSAEFGEFTRNDLDRFARDLTSSRAQVDDALAMVTEIITRSGLLSDVSDDENDDDDDHDNGARDEKDRQRFFFAHRSIQEFLCARELRQLAGGDGFLSSRATDPTWRQTTLFYTAGEEAQSVDGFLSELARRNTDLAAHCLQAAKPSNGVARIVLDALQPMTSDKLSALAAAARSSLQTVREMAISHLKNFLIRSAGTSFSAGVGVDGMLPVLESLADADAAEIAALVPQVIRNLPNDPRLVGPLWRCLNAHGIELYKRECDEIVQRLLTLVMDFEAFAELSRRDPVDREFLTRIRLRAYPFRRALPHRHNIVTLLAFAEYLDVSPSQPNRFFQAKHAGFLPQVEIDRRRTISLSLCWPGRIVSGLELLAGVIGAITVLATDPGSLMSPYGWHTLLVISFAELAGPMFHILALNSRLTGVSGFAELFAELPDETGNITSAMPADLRRTLGPLPHFLIFTIPFALAPLIKFFLPGYFVLSVVAFTSYFLTSNRFFDRDERHYLYRPNEFVDMYDDPRSRHWLVPSARPGL